MFKLVVVCKFDPLSNLPDLVEELDEEFEDSPSAELRALLWLHYRPKDVVMLLELEVGDCKHCGEPIEEIPGWILYKFKHVRTGGRTCIQTGGATRAEPKEDG